jgi:hypothetical protein
VESVGDGLWVDAVSGRDRGEPEPSGVQVGRVCEGLADPLIVGVVSLDVVAVEGCGDGGSMVPVPVGEFVDRCACAVCGDEFGDVSGGEASLGSSLKAVPLLPVAVDGCSPGPC